MNQHPLLIGGAPRSGTTALIQLLNTNPSVFISSEENLLKLARDCKKLLSTKERRGLSLAHGMRATSARETLNETNIHSHNFTQAATWPAIKYIYKWHHKNIHPLIPLKIWGDKLPNYFREIDSIIESNKFKYLHITRNPLDVINSMLRRTEMARQGKDWWKAITEFDGMLSAWCTAYEAIERHETHERVLHIHYEDLLFKYSDTILEINLFIANDLSYKNILINDKSLHFDRKYLDDTFIEKIISNATVARYMETRKLNKANNFSQSDK